MSWPIMDLHPYYKSNVGIILFINLTLIFTKLHYVFI